MGGGRIVSRNTQQREVTEDWYELGAPFFVQKLFKIHVCLCGLMELWLGCRFERHENIDLRVEISEMLLAFVYYFMRCLKCLDVLLWLLDSHILQFVFRWDPSNFCFVLNLYSRHFV